MRKRKSKKTRSSPPPPFSVMGRRARVLLTKDYNYHKKFCLSFPSSAGMTIKADGDIMNQKFLGLIRTQFQSEKTTVDVRINTSSNVFTVLNYKVLPSTKATVRFSVSDHGEFGKLELHYLHPHAAIDSCIKLKPSPLLEFAAAIGSKYFAIGGEVTFDINSSSFTMYNAGVSYNKTDFSAALVWSELRNMVTASYIHSVNLMTTVAVEMAHDLFRRRTGFTIGCSHRVDPLTTVKAKFSDDGKVAALSQLKWRPKSLVTVSAEYDLKSSRGAHKFGLAIVLSP